MKKVKAFTLVEILIVVVLLGILAAIVIPAFAGGAMSARSSALAQDLRILQRFILIYKSQHMEIAPRLRQWQYGQCSHRAGLY
jgi:general secretion pathway protein G